MRQTNILPVLLMLLLCSIFTLPAFAQNSWIEKGGIWKLTHEVVPMIHQGQAQGPAIAICNELTGGTGSWRIVVEPSLGAEEAGMWILTDKAATAGYVVTLGSAPGAEGFVLRSAGGEILWADQYAPWRYYQPYVLEAVVEAGKIRVQLFEADGATLISQGPWVDMPAAPANTTGALGLYTNNGKARFWGLEIATTPLSPIVPDAPNKRRLVQDANSPWKIIGGGNWLWTSTEKTRLRQGRVVERTTAISLVPHASEGTWQCIVRVSPGTGGSGILFHTDAELKSGFSAWLGGEFGNGGLMIYRNPLDCLWSGPQGCWKYDTDYLLRAETLNGKVRVHLLDATGTTLLQQSPWFDMTEEEKNREGLLSFQTWLGTADFWGFSEETMAGATPVIATVPSALNDIGNGWNALGTGNWQWVDKSLKIDNVTSQTLALNPAISGIMGKWSTQVTVAAKTTAGVAFQVSADGKAGFAAVLTNGVPQLLNLSGKVMWQDKGLTLNPGVPYVLEGEVMTDRVAMRVFDTTGKLLSECPAIYISTDNNNRTGCLGLLISAGAANFSDWTLE